MNNEHYTNETTVSQINNIFFGKVNNIVVEKFDTLTEKACKYIQEHTNTITDNDYNNLVSKRKEHTVLIYTKNTPNNNNHENLSPSGNPSNPSKRFPGVNSNNPNLFNTTTKYDNA